MVVHVGEIHTDVVPAVAPAGQPAQDASPKSVGARDDAWAESYRFAAMMSRRTAAQGFDD
jgi:hypothetical protein